MKTCKDKEVMKVNKPKWVRVPSSRYNSTTGKPMYRHYLTVKVNEQRLFLLEICIHEYYDRNRVPRWTNDSMWMIADCCYLGRRSGDPVGGKTYKTIGKAKSAAMQILKKAIS